jgi:hypothetical protein
MGVISSSELLNITDKAYKCPKSKKKLYYNLINKQTNNGIVGKFNLI